MLGWRKISSNDDDDDDDKCDIILDGILYNLCE